MHEHCQHLFEIGSGRKASGGFVTTTEGVERAASHAPGLTGGTVATGQRQRVEVAQAAEFGAIHIEQFASPGQPVGTEADAVGRQTEHRAIEAMLGTDGRDMGVVVQHGNGGHVERVRHGQGGTGRV